MPLGTEKTSLLGAAAVGQTVAEILVVAGGGGGGSPYAGCTGGVWRRQTQFTLKHVREITHVLVLTRSYLAVLNANKIEQNWENAVSFWTSQAGIQVLSRGDNYDHTIAESEESTTWLTRLKTSMRYQSDCVGTESKLDRIISNMVNYFQTPRT